MNSLKDLEQYVDDAVAHFIKILQERQKGILKWGFSFTSLHLVSVFLLP